MKSDGNLFHWYYQFTSATLIVEIFSKSSEHAQEIIAKKKAQLDKDAQQYPLGLRKQYEQQLRFFEDDVPVIEFLNVAASITPVPDPSKPHLMVVATLVHPWSRGTIVRLPCLIQWIDSQALL